jgi:hypothetical protein
MPSYFTSGSKPPRISVKNPERTPNAIKGPRQNPFQEARFHFASSAAHLRFQFKSCSFDL